MMNKRGRFLQRLVRSKKGITTLDMTVAFAILTFSVMGSVALLIRAEQKSQDVQNKLLALGSARSLMEAIKTTPLAEIQSLDHEQYLATDLPNGSIAVTSSPVDVSSVDVATVTVTVAWIGAEGRNRTFDLSFVKTKYGRVT